MKIDATTYQELPEHLKALFQRAPNPSREEILSAFPDVKTGAVKPHLRAEGAKSGYSGGLGREKTLVHAASDGSAARFFYCAKASKKDRDDGLPQDTTSQRQGNRPGSPDETGKFPDHDHRESTGNIHPTVKPTELMRYLCRLVTPPDGVVLDPFMGSGSTGKAAMIEGFRFVGIEMNHDYFAIAEKRIKNEVNNRLIFE